MNFSNIMPIFKRYHVSLVSGKINQKLGTSFKFKNVVPAVATASASGINGRSFPQLNLFLQEEA